VLRVPAKHRPTCVLQSGEDVRPLLDLLIEHALGVQPPAPTRLDVVGTRGGKATVEVH